MQDPQRVRRIGPRIGAALRAEIDLRKRNARVASETLGIGFVELLQLGFRRLGSTQRVVDQEGQFLRQASPDDDVIVFETQGAGLAREQLFVQVIGNQSAKLLTRRWPPPLRGPILRKPLDVARTDVNLRCLAGGWSFRGAIDPRVGAEQGGARQHEMKQGFFQHFHAAAPQTLVGPGACTPGQSLKG